MPYKDYLKSSHWKETRKKKLEEKEVCQVCGSSKNLHIHHKSYEHHGKKVLGNEKNKSLVTLCASCHKLTHSHFGIEVKKLNKKFCQVRRLIELGATKKKSFWVVGKGNDFFYAIRDGLLKRKKEELI